MRKSQLQGGNYKTRHATAKGKGIDSQTEVATDVSSANGESLRKTDSVMSLMCTYLNSDINGITNAPGINTLPHIVIL